MKSIPQITFEQLSHCYDTYQASANPELQLTQVEIRGFLYPKSEGDWVLSAESNLKSCCLETSNKKGSQILIPGQFSEVSLIKAVVLRGNLKINPESAYFYILEDSILINEISSESPTIYLVLLLSAIFIFTFKLLKNKKIESEKNNII